MTTQLCYLRLPTGNLSGSKRFVEDIVGLEPAAARDDIATYRSDERGHTLALVTAGTPTIGVAVRDLTAVVERLRAHGAPVRALSQAECELRLVLAAVSTLDASGNVIELVERPGIASRRFFPSRDTGITGLRAIALRSTDIAGDTRFWTEALGAIVADWVGDITYLRLDNAHHRVVLYPSDRAGVLYQAYSVRDMDAIMRHRYRLADHQIEIVHGPGREAASGEVFLRFQGPEGMLFALQTEGDGEALPPTHPRQFLATADALCAWGSRCENVPELALPACGAADNRWSAP